MAGPGWVRFFCKSTRSGPDRVSFSSASDRRHRHLGRRSSTSPVPRGSSGGGDKKRAYYSYGWVLRAADRVWRYLCARPGHLGRACSPATRQFTRIPGGVLRDAVGRLCCRAAACFAGSGSAGKKFMSYASRCLDQPARGLRRHKRTIPRSRCCNCPENTGEEISLPAPRRQGHDLAMLLFTSGSMGTPKGVMLSHRNLLANADSILRELPIGADDRALVVLPFCHALRQLCSANACCWPAPRCSCGRPDVSRRDCRCVASVGRHVLFRDSGTLRHAAEIWAARSNSRSRALRYMTVAGGELRYALAAEIAHRIAPATFI